MNKGTKSTNEIKDLFEKLLNFKILEANDIKISSAAGKKSKDGVKNSPEEIKKTLTQINNHLKRGTNLSKNQKIFLSFYQIKDLKN